MKEVKTGKGTFVFVETTREPQGEYPAKWKYHYWGGSPFNSDKEKDPPRHELVDGFGNTINLNLPPGFFTFIGTTKDITEEKADGIVNKWMTGEGNYYWHYGTAERFATAIAALQSLLTSQGLGGSKKNYAILRKL